MKETNKVKKPKKDKQIPRFTVEYKPVVIVFD